MKKKYAMTLLEIMIVIFIIGIIGSVVGYNMRGSLDQGKAFKTKEGARKLYEIVQLEEAQNANIFKDISDGKIEPTIIVGILESSGLVRNPREIVRDGWGDSYEFELDRRKLRFHSEKYDAYCERKGVEREYPWEE